MPSSSSAEEKSKLLRSNLPNPIDWSNNLLLEMSYMYHAGMVAPKFAVTGIDGLDLVKPKIRVLFEKDPGDAWLTRAVRST
jgi:hypothetical protein